MQAYQDNIPPLVKASSTTLTLASTYLGQPTMVTVGGQSYLIPSQLTLNAATVGANGLDAGALQANKNYFVYAIVNQSTFAVALVASLVAPSTGPTHPSNTGTAQKLVGGFSTDNGSLIATVSTPAQITQGSATGNDIAYAPTNLNTTNISANTAKYRVAGGYLEIIGRVEWNGAGAGAGVFYIGLPPGFTTSAANNATVGYFKFLDSGTSNKTGICQVYSTVAFMCTENGNTGTALIGTVFAANDAIEYHLSIPVNELSSGGIFGPLS